MSKKTYSNLSHLSFDERRAFHAAIDKNWELIKTSSSYEEYIELAKKEQLHIYDFDYWKFQKNFFTEWEYKKSDEFKKVEEAKQKIDRLIIKRHKKYVFILITGTIIGITSCILFPFLYGFLKEILTPTNSHFELKHGLVSGALSCCTFMYFGGYFLITPSIIASVILWPWILKKMMFTHQEDIFYQTKDNDKNAFYPEVMAMLKCKGIEKTNAATVIGSQII